MAKQSFKDLLAWQKANDLTFDIYKTFRANKDFSFRDQIQRASLSIMNNIAEGYARRSDKALKNYLSIAKGSAAEVESMLIIAKRLGYINGEEKEYLVINTEEVSKIISGLIKKLSAVSSEH